MSTDGRNVDPRWPKGALCNSPETTKIEENWYESRKIRVNCSIQNENNDCKNFKMKDLPEKEIESKSLGITAALYKVIRCDWTEYERGWGQRPDGTTLHLNMEEFKAYCEEFDTKERLRNNSGKVPDEYSTYGDPVETLVTQSLYERCVHEKSFWIQMSGTWNNPNVP